ncbi:hypothetical protein [Nocardioides daejeonensis]|uniref:hypothetical protein n=1 Tax=Nocardioides daejeonensis TaxID=1046556 RepID=UPI000D74187E|nr:hypothetical protein [Nocardioides daejeonensis]
MAVIPPEVGQRSRDWDDQNLDLTAAAGQVSDSGTGGFTPTVRTAAKTFRTAWHGHLTTLATDAESQADGLRETMTDWLNTDQSADVQQRSLIDPYVQEIR